MTPQFFKSHHWGWGPLVLLVAVTQIGLLWLSIRHEQTRDQERLDGLAAEAVGEFRHRLRQDIDRLQDLIADAPAPERFSPAVATLLRERREVLRVETRSSAMALQRSVASQYGALPERSRLSREQQEGEQLAACRTAQHLGVPRLSRSYYMAAAAGGGAEVLDVCVPMIENRQAVGYLTATLDLPRLLEQVLGSRALRAYSLVLRDADGNRLANAGPRMDADAPAAQRLLEIAGLTLELQLRQRRHLPWMPQPALVLGLTLSLALAAVLVLLMRDVRRRTAAERELAEALALRRAMEDSLVTGLLARDLAGRLTYVNRAFCRMVDLPADALLGSLHPPCLAAPVAVGGARDDGRPHEAMLRRRDGTVFPVQLHDAPLLDAAQRQTGWLCAVVDVTAQRRADELLRQQQDTLQASARLAMMGEMASLLSHELNQPLTAIVGYANGTLNLLDELLTHPGAQEQAMLGHALQRIAEQGDRAGRVIKSVQDFVRRRETCREPRRAAAVRRSRSMCRRPRRGCSATRR